MDNLIYDMYSKIAVGNAIELAKKTGGELRPEHLLHGITEFGNGVQIMLTQYGLTMYKIDKYLDYTARVNQVRTSNLAKEVLIKANQLSKKHADGQINLIFLFLGLLAVPSTVSVILADCGIDPTSMYNKLIAKFGGEQIKESTSFSTPQSNPKPSSTQQQSVQTQEKLFDEKKYYQEDSVLFKLTTDLTLKAKKGQIDPVFGRGKEIERMIQILLRRTKNNPVLVGEPGVGKTAIVEGLALEIVNGKVPPLADKRILSLDVGSLVSGTKYRGEFEERLQTIVKEVQKYGDIILFIDEIHTLVNAGSTENSALDASNILKPMLARGELQTIGATTMDEYRKYFEKDPALERRFQPITVEPPTVEQSILILQGLRTKYENYHGISISDEAIQAACVLSDKYITDRFLPDKAIDLIDEGASKCKISGNISVLDAETIAKIVSDWTDIPVTKLTSQETDKLSNLEHILSTRVIGQQKAIKTVAGAIRRARVGLKDSNKPIGSFIFLGSSGVGKTELAKAIAEAMFGNENKLIRFDMSEYKDKSSINRLTGSAPGFVGFEDGGQLTEKVRKKPYSVILFDEIEKADPEVFSIFLQIMDDGRLTDGQGRTVSFKNCVIIMTSNIGSDLQVKNSNLGFGATNLVDDFESRHIQALKRTMKPEFINRLDEIVVFNPLTKSDLSKIFDLLLVQLANKLIEKNIKIKISMQAKDFIVKNGSSLEYGARPLKRTIRTMLEDKLSEYILAGTLKSGDTIWIDFARNELTFSIR